MVNSINNNGPISTLLRAQSAGAPINAAGQTPQQTLVSQQQNGAKPTTIQPSTKVAGSNGDNLPRGSLVDILV